MNLNVSRSILTFSVFVDAMHEVRSLLVRPSSINTRGCSYIVNLLDFIVGIREITLLWQVLRELAQGST